MMKLDEKVWIKWRRGDRKGLWVGREDIKALDSQSRGRQIKGEGGCVEMGGKNVCE